MTMSIRFSTTALTHEGRVKPVNEDSFLDVHEAGLWAVADGMGGRAAGEVASALVIEALQAAVLEGDLEARINQIAAALGSANAAILAEAQRTSSEMGSTAVVLHIFDTQVACLWVGDSRIYRFRQGRLAQLSRDHTHVQEMVDRGQLTPEEARRHPMRHVISRGLGVEASVGIDVVTDDLRASDIFLLCSDGLSTVLSDEEIAARLLSARRNACQVLLDETLARGAPDNVTVLGVVCDEQTTLVFDHQA
jgi:serine/threonine protein phosphatase PrpC